MQGVRGDAEKGFERQGARAEQVYAGFEYGPIYEGDVVDFGKISEG
jgi:hypothetical protein